MAETYSRKPFTSYDGEDENGVRAQVKVVVGYGRIDSIVPSDAGKSNKVSFSVENTKYLPSGWAPEGSNVLDKLKEAEERGEPIHFRLETRRKPSISRDEPIDELTTLARAKDSIFKSVAAVKLEGDEEWTISPHAVTHMSEDPSTGGNGIYPASAMSADKLGSKSASAGKTYAGIEPAPYINHLKDGRVNPGSIAASVPLNLLSFVAEWDRDHSEDATAQVGENRRAAVAKVLLMAANELQLAIWDGEMTTPDLGAGSHTRARGLLFEVIRSYYPLSSELVESKESLMAWKTELVNKSLAMWKWSLNEAKAAMSSE